MVCKAGGMLPEFMLAGELVLFVDGVSGSEGRIADVQWLRCRSNDVIHGSFDDYTTQKSTGTPSIFSVREPSMLRTISSRWSKRQTYTNKDKWPGNSQLPVTPTVPEGSFQSL